MQNIAIPPLRLGLGANARERFSFQDVWQSGKSTVLGTVEI